MARVEIQYSPNETPLFEGQISLDPVDGEELPTTHVSVEGQPSLELEFTSKRENPLRTVHSGYFLRHGDSAVRLCNVSLDLPEQPSTEIVARAILATFPESEKGRVIFQAPQQTWA